MDSYWMNEYEIDDLVGQFSPSEQPNLLKAVGIIDRLRNWTNRNSDGWPYWQLPSKAAGKLMALVHSKRYQWQIPAGESLDISDADLKRALTPVKSFLTKQGVEHGEILDDPEPYCNHDPAAITETPTGLKCECGATMKAITTFVAVPG